GDPAPLPSPKRLQGYALPEMGRTPKHIPTDDAGHLFRNFPPNPFRAMPGMIRAAWSESSDGLTRKVVHIRLVRRTGRRLHSARLPLNFDIDLVVSNYTSGASCLETNSSLLREPIPG